MTTLADPGGVPHLFRGAELEFLSDSPPQHYG